MTATMYEANISTDPEVACQSPDPELLKSLTLNNLKHNPVAIGGFV